MKNPRFAALFLHKSTLVFLFNNKPYKNKLFIVRGTNFPPLFSYKSTLVFFSNKKTYKNKLYILNMKNFPPLFSTVSTLVSFSNNNPYKNLYLLFLKQEQTNQYQHSSLNKVIMYRWLLSKQMLSYVSRDLRGRAEIYVW